LGWSATGIDTGLHSLSLAYASVMLEPGNECSLCSSDYDPDCGGVQGYFGIIPVTFCEWCYSSIIDMASQHMSLTDEEDPIEEDEE